ncbi:MAG TPA: DUF4340 domain-containing protein [Kofleriaceae bacterium]|nr:DUF4340 domain-containing protein [Kofleriaceae bacterium]
MDSRRWLAALGALAVALAVILAVDLARDRGPAAGGRIVPELDPDAVTALRLERAGGAPIALERDGDGWRLVAPVAAPADPAAVADLLGAIEILASRRLDGGRVDPVALRVRLDRPGGPVELAFGEAGATDRAWVAIAGRPGRALVDGYLVRDLAVGPDDVRDRRPLRALAGQVTSLEIAAGDRSVALTGPPWRVGQVRADPAAAERLVAGLVGLRLERFVDPAPAAAPGALRVVASGPRGRAAITFHGPCPAGRGVLTTSSAGAGCAPAAERERFDRALGDPEALYDRRPVAAAPAQVTRARLSAGDRSVEVERADAPEALRTWLEELRAAATGEVVPAAGLAATGSIEIELEGGGRELVHIARAPGGALVARRDGEPVALVLRPEAAELVEPAPHRFRSLDLLTFDPSALRAATARRGARAVEAVERGELLEDWRAAAPAGAELLPDAVDRLRQEAGYLRASRVVAGRAGPGHGLAPPRRAVDLVFDPPPGGGQPVRRTVEIGAARPGGACLARLDGDPVVFELPAGRCAALLGPWTRAGR